MPPDPNDLTLVARANGGDSAALEQIYSRYRLWVYRQALHKLGDADEAHDVTQDVFLRLLKRFPGFELRVAMTTYLYEIVSGLCVDRRERRRPTVNIDDADAGSEPLSSQPEPAADDPKRMLAHLSPQHRETLTLFYIDDMSLQQIAETLNIPLGTVKSRLHHAVLAARQKLTAVRHGESVPVARRRANDE